MSASSLSPGFVFAGRYRVVRLIASGGMGAVYDAKHVVTGRRCAIKVMLGHTLDNMELRSRFLHEAKIAARIRSNHIVDILDAGIEESLDLPYLVMEFLEGEDLSHRLQRRGAMTLAETVTCLWQVATALDKMHRAGVIHRDLKPRNLFLTKAEDGTALYKVVDFGVAKMMPREKAAEQATQNIGTPLYMAPEQFHAEGRIGPATDIYALGMIAYVLLVGEHYWAEENRRSNNPFVFSRLVADGPLEPPIVRAAREQVELPAAFDDWFLRATAVAPADRFTTATEAVTELALALDVPAPLVEPDEITGPGDLEDLQADAPQEPFAQGETVDVGGHQSTAAAAATVRDGDATAASLSVTSGSGRRARRIRPWPYVVALAMIGLAVAAFALGRSRAGPPSSTAQQPPIASANVPPPTSPSPVETSRAAEVTAPANTAAPLSSASVSPVDVAGAPTAAEALPLAHPPAAPKAVSTTTRPAAPKNAGDSRVRLYKRD